MERWIMVSDGNAGCNRCTPNDPQTHDKGDGKVGKVRKGMNPFIPPAMG